MADASRSGSSRYLVTARKYRPQTFADLVSQEHVTETLQNAILHDRLAHAYLFSGPRGVGKTTAARLLAKAINCQTPLEERDGAEPCRTCERCRAFEEGRSLDVIEIDAASNNGVDDIRDLQERIRIPPQGANRKVYIVDEVHMLSKPAFNALLKTLEEPPPHVLFIFATTEPHKVLPTILSRCQRFDFRRITVPQTVERLQEICAAEGIAADDASLHLIARKGDGALRDALSIFDQAVSLCGTDLRYAELAEALGVVETDLFFEVTDRTQSGDRAGLLHLVETLVRRGYDLQEFLAGLAEHYRGLYVAVSTGTADLVEADEATRARYVEAAAGRAEPDLLRALMVIDEAEREIKNSAQPRLKLELALLKLASLGHVTDLRTLLKKLERLEGMIERGEVPQLPPTSDASPARSAERPSHGTSEPPTPSYAEPAGSSAPESSPTEPAPSSHAEPAPSAAEPTPSAKTDTAPAPAPPTENGEKRDAEAAGTPDDRDAPPSAPPPAQERPPAAEPPPSGPAPSKAAPSKPAPPQPEPAAGGEDNLRLGLFGAPALQRKSSQDDGPSALGDGANGRAEAVSVAAADVHFGVSLHRVREVWPRLIATVKAERPSVAGVLAQVEPAGVEHGTVQVAVPSVFVQRLLQSESATFAAALAEAMGEESPPLAFVVHTPSADETAAPADPFERIKQLRNEHPVIRAIFEQFGGEIVWT
jgi:DNA polymerase-3 subunit gamma/tau